MEQVSEGCPHAITRMELFDEWLKVKDLKRTDCCNVLQHYVFEKHNISRYNSYELLEKFVKNVEMRWKSRKNNLSHFLKNNDNWLLSTISFPVESEESQPGPSKRGRPTKSFSESGTRAKQIKVKALTSASTTEELSFALQANLRKRGQRNAATVVGKITSRHSLQYTKKIYKMVKSSAKLQKKAVITPEEALSLIINTKSSKSTYLSYRMAAKSLGVDIFPSWNKILSAKAECFAEPGAVIVEDTGVEIDLNKLLHLTAKRLCKLREEAINSFTGSGLTLICKWGIDGSSGQSNYRQMTSANKNDSSVVIVSLVPIQLRDCNDETHIIWQNPVPSSTRFCRAIKFVYAKETPELIQNITERIQTQIDGLENFVHKEISVNFNLILTMIDGKICNILTNTKSTQSCYICGATPRNMNCLEMIEKMPVKTDHFRFGLYTLHAWIRFFECCLHLGYRMEIKCWQARGTAKVEIRERKNMIVDKLKMELGILVDQPRSGYGSTNTGNTSRVFFRNWEKAADITGVDKGLIHRFYIILQTISCGYEVDPEKFNTYAMDTARKFVSLYPWFYMPPSIHKVLVHGAEIIKYAVLPIGQLGEEAQEAKNKDFKFIREHRTRKDSANHTNEDLFNYLLLSSDPVISYFSLKEKGTKQKISLDSDAINLLKSPACNILSESDDE